jgi:hypothetical protein
MCSTTIAPMSKKYCHRGHREHRGNIINMVFNSVFSVNSVARACFVFLHAFVSWRELFIMDGANNE